MNLGQKTLAIVLLTLVGSMAVLYATTRGLILHSFLELEQRDTRAAMERAQNALKDDIAGLASTTNDYGAWDRTYEFMAHPSSGYIRQEFQDDTLQGLGLNSVLLVDSRGHIVYSKGYDFVGKKDVTVPDTIFGGLAADPWVRKAEVSMTPASGIVLLPGGPALIAACPVLTSQRTGPERGVIVMTRNLDTARVAFLKGVTRSHLQVELLSGGALDGDSAVALQTLQAGRDEIFVHPLNNNVVAGHALLKDIHGRPVLLLDFEGPREVFQRALASLRLFVAALCAVGLVFGLVTWLLLRHAVIARLMRLNAEIRRIGQSRDLAGRVKTGGNDELGALALAINSALQALQKSDSQFHYLAENIHQVFWVREAASQRFNYVSPACERVWGQTQEQIYAGPSAWRQSVHPDDRATVAAMLQTQLQGRSSEAEYRIVGPDGKSRWVWERSFPVSTSAAGPVQIVGLAEDITARKQAEEVLLRSQEELEARVRDRTAALAKVNKALRSSEEHFRQLFATVPIPIWVYRATGHQFLEVNDAAVKQYGHSRGQLLTMKLEDLLAPEELQHPAAALSDASAPETLRCCKHRTKDGSTIDVEASARTVDFNGVPAVLMVSSNVTERTRMEIELRHGQKLQAVGGLAAGVAHEINTPIQFVGDNLRFLQDAFSGLDTLAQKYQQALDSCQDRPLSPRLAEDLAGVKQQVDIDYLRVEVPSALVHALEGIGRVATIVRALKEFSHVDWGLEKTPADINRALQSTIAVARNELKYVAEVETSYGEVPPVLCHLGDLNQVFLNLLVNAAHSIGDVVGKNGHDKGVIRVETATEDDFVVITIKDTGAGIPEAVRGRIFEPFFTTKEVGKGSGQGLALARAIVVEKHGGTLTFETEVGKGTAFQVRIPIGEVPASDLTFTAVAP